VLPFAHLLGRFPETGMEWVLVLAVVQVKEMEME